MHLKATSYQVLLVNEDVVAPTAAVERLDESDAPLVVPTLNLGQSQTCRMVTHRYLTNTPAC